MILDWRLMVLALRNKTDLPTNKKRQSAHYAGAFICHKRNLSFEFGSIIN